MPTQFHKMHGAGNDVVLLDYRQSGEQLGPEQAARIADRRLGIGCDQVLVLHKSQIRNCVARYEVFNSDGGRAGQCGNGLRCIALYLQTRGELGDHAPAQAGGQKRDVMLEGPSGPVSVSLCSDGEFECGMGEPAFEPSKIPLDTGHPGIHSQDDYFVLDVDGSAIEVRPASMGNPHAVTLVDDVGTAPVERLGPLISRHPAFPSGCNAGFAQVVDRDNIRLRVFERGAGETLACGSGACAAVAVLARAGLLSNEVNVFLPGGHLVIKWNGPGRPVTMKGPAAHVFRGTLDE